MVQRSIQAGTYLMDGIRMLNEPGLRRYVWIPLLINTLLFAGAIALMVTQFGQLLERLLATLPDWLLYFDWIAWIIQGLFTLIFGFAILVLIFFGFTLVASIIAAPFNALLAEVVERRLRGQSVSDEDGWRELLILLPRTLARIGQLLLYFLPRFIALLLLSLIPGINLIATLLLALFSAWMMAIQYFDYVADNQKVSFNQMLAEMRANRWQCFCFGALVLLGMMVPLLNLLFMPAAVIGATRLWIIERMGPHNRIDASR